MLSRDDLTNGATFILKLVDSAGLSAQWVAVLRGDDAARWYEVYRNSDWEALRVRGATVFREPVSEAEAERVRRSGRCIVIHTSSVIAEEIDPPVQRSTSLN